LPIGSYFFTIYEVDFGHCKNTTVETLPVNVRFPVCSLAQHGSAPCYGDDYYVEVSGDAGVYTVEDNFGVSYNVTVTTGGMTLAGPYHMPGATGLSIPYGITTLCVTKIVGCGGCTSTATEGSELCCLHVTARMVPVFMLDVSAYCTDQPFNVAVHFGGGLGISPHSSQWYPNLDYPGDGLTSPAHLSQTITTSLTGLHTYSVTIADDNGCSFTNSTTIDLEPAPAPITGPTTVCVGSSISVACTTPGGVWSPYAWYGPYTTGLVDQSGKVTAYNAGSATIWYTLPGGCRSLYYVSVTPGNPIMGADRICGIGGTTTLSDAILGGIWSSSDPTIVTVDPFGHVTAVGPGIATVTYTLPGGGPCIPTHEINVITSTSAWVTTFHPGWSTGWGLPGGADPYLYRIYGPVGATVKFSVTESTGGCSVFPFVFHGGLTNLGGGVYSFYIPPIGFADIDGNFLGLWFPDCSITSLSLIDMDVDVDGSLCHVSLSSSAVPRSSGTTDDTVANSGSRIREGQSLKVIPNPTAGTLMLTGNIADVNTKEITVQIMDMLGNLVVAKSVAVENGAIKATLILPNDAANGTYLIRVRNNGINEVVHFSLLR
jgi:hypothetical protein